MKPWNDSSLPDQATPTKATSPAHLCAASSTEGASRLQVPQPGAQNQNTTGAPATEAPSNVPPPTSGAVNCNEAGTTAAGSPTPSVVATAVSMVVVPGAAVEGDCGAGVDSVGSTEVLTGAASEAVSSPHATRTRPAAQHSAAIRRLRGDMPPGYPL
jgi:hypothetical protein